MLPCILSYISSPGEVQEFLLVVYLELGSSYECLTLGGNAALFSRVVAPMYIPNSDVYKSLCIQILGALKSSFSGFIAKEILI